MLTKAELKVLQFFVSSVTKSFRSTDVSELLGIDNKNARMALKSLAAAGFLKTNHNLYGLDYSGNHQKLAYAEHLRSEEFLRKKKNGFVRLFVEDALRKLKEDSFILLIFGSTVEKPNPRDTDVLVIADSKKQAESIERTLQGIISTLKLDVHVHWSESAYEMLEKRDGKNILLRALDRHLIFYGAERFYRMLSRGRRQ